MMENYYVVHASGEEPFLVSSKRVMTEREVIDKCKQERLFIEQSNAKSAWVDMNPTNSEIAKHGSFIPI